MKSFGIAWAAFGSLSLTMPVAAQIEIQPAIPSPAEREAEARQRAEELNRRNAAKLAEAQDFAARQAPVYRDLADAVLAHGLMGDSIDAASIESNMTIYGPVNDGSLAKLETVVREHFEAKRAAQVEVARPFLIHYLAGALDEAAAGRALAVARQDGGTELIRASSAAWAVNFASLMVVIDEKTSLDCRIRLAGLNGMPGMNGASGNAQCTADGKSVRSTQPGESE